MANQSWSGNGLAILLANGNSPSFVYTGGDRVKGKVVWTASRNLRVKSVVLYFEGVVKTSVKHDDGKERQTIHSNVSLFKCTQVLSQGLQQNTGESLSWDFDFEFPSSHTAYTTLNAPSIFYHFRDHQLPPTLSGRGGRQEIFYYIQVIAYTPSMLRRPVKTWVALPFSPFRNEPYPDHQFNKSTITIFRNTRKLDSALPAKHRSIMDRACCLFGWSIPSEPTWTFSVHLEVPKVAYVNGKLPIFISIKHDLAKLTSREIPVIYLQEFVARLTAQTTVEAGGHHHSWHTTIPILGGHYIRHYTRPLTERTNIGEMLNLGHITPTFRTYNVNRQYFLKIRAKVICAEKSYKIKLGYHHLSILPGLYKPQAGGSGGSGPRDTGCSKGGNLTSI